MEDERNGPDDVRGVVDRVENAGEDEAVTVAELMDEIGNGAFGPLLLVPALILVTPVSGIPGMPTIGSLIISLIAVQIVIGVRRLWLPRFLRERSVKRARLEKAMGYLRWPARIVDRFTRERLVFLTQRPLSTAPALICSAMVLFAPAFETVPFSVSVVAGGVSLFALAFVTKDGLLVLLGLALVAGAVYLGWTTLG